VRSDARGKGPGLGLDPSQRPAELAVSAVLAGGAFVVYAAGACRTIYVGDSGELVAAVHTLGIPHPSGYPLYVLLGKLWTGLVPFGSIAFRMSLFSALFAGLAVGLVYLAGRALDAGRIAAATAALLFAASPSFWAEANIQRVYSLNAFFVALVSWLAVQWHVLRKSPAGRAQPRDRRFVAIAFVCGVGATNHTFLALWGLCFLGFALFSDSGLLRRGRTLLAAAGAAAGGLALYLYLPLRSRQEPRLDWGNPETPDALLAVVTRHDFWARRWWSGWPDALPIAVDFLNSFATEITLAGALLALVGLVAGLQRRRSVLLLVWVAVGNLVILALHGSRSDIFLWHRYYIPSYLSAALLAAVGLDEALRALRRLSARVATAAAGLVVLGAVTLLILRFPEHDRSRYRIAEDYSRALLAQLPPGAHLAASDDNILFVLIYLQLVEGARPDIDLILQGVGGELPPLRFDPDREPLFFSHHPNWQNPALDVVSVGLVFRVVRRGAPPPPRHLPAKLQLEGENDPGVPKDYLTRNLIGEFHFMLGVTFERSEPSRALAEFEVAARAAPDNDVLFYNLGLVYERMGLPDQALTAFERSAAINPREIPGPSRVRASDRVAELRRRLSAGTVAH